MIIQSAENLLTRKKNHKYVSFLTTPLNLNRLGKPQTINEKPRGLWYSPNGCWLNFLYMPFDDWWGNKIAQEIQFGYQVELIESRILKIDNLKDFANFTEKYGTQDFNLKQHVPKKKFRYIELIDWGKVSKDHLGIDISFNTVAANRFHWYHGWDVSSGCVWDIRAIESIEVL